MDLVKGSHYTRSQVREILGGSTQGGILSTQKAPAVILYSDRHGKQHGYEDKWDPDGFYHYTGAGRTGPMEMKRGNKAVRDHVRNGKSLVLFVETEKRRVYRFEGFMELVDHYGREIPSKDGGVRTAIIFRLRPVEAVALTDGNRAPKLDTPIELLRERALLASHSVVDKSTRQTTYRERSEDVKAWVLARARGFCEGCGRPAPFPRRSNSSPYLESHHTQRISDDGLDSPDTVIALCPTCHRRVHHGTDGSLYNARLQEVARAAEKAYEQKRVVVVTAAVISDSAKRVLLCQRDRGSLAGYWEFPGGKVDRGEEPEESVRREIREELRLEVDKVTPFMMTDFDYDEFYVRLLCFRCSAEGSPTLLEHRDARWVAVDDLESLTLAPADIAVGSRLRERS